MATACSYCMINFNSSRSEKTKTENIEIEFGRQPLAVVIAKRDAVAKTENPFKFHRLSVVTETESNCKSGGDLITGQAFCQQADRLALFYDPGHGEIAGSLAM